ASHAAWERPAPGVWGTLRSPLGGSGPIRSPPLTYTSTTSHEDRVGSSCSYMGTRLRDDLTRCLGSPGRNLTKNFCRSHRRETRWAVCWFPGGSANNSVHYVRVRRAILGVRPLEVEIMAIFAYGPKQIRSLESTLAAKLPKNAANRPRAELTRYIKERFA